MKHETLVLSNKLVKVELPLRKNYWKADNWSVRTWTEQISLFFLTRLSTDDLRQVFGCQKFPPFHRKRKKKTHGKTLVWQMTQSRFYP